MSFLEQLKKIEDLTSKLIDAADKLAAPLELQHSSKEIDNAVLNTFRQGEFLAHDLAYTLTSKYNSVSVIDEDGIERVYLVKQILTDDPGLVAFILFDKTKENPRIHVVFRGTHNVASAMRDIEHATEGGPGFASFKRNETNILQTVATIVKDKQEKSHAPVVLNVAGHSLGGADVQNFVRLLLQSMATPSSPYYGSLNKIDTLNILHANSAGVTEETAAICEASLKLIKNMNNELQINQYIIHFGGDLVQQMGNATIFADTPYQLVNTYMLKGDAGQEGVFAKAIMTDGIYAFKRGLFGTYTAHTNMAFPAKDKTSEEKVQFKLYHNADEKDALEIARGLNNKIMQKAKILYAAATTLAELGSVASEVGSTIVSYWDKVVNRRPKG